MEYRIKSIKHSGSKGERETERTEPDYVKRIGRVVDLDYDRVFPGVTLWLDYLRDSDGSEILNKSLWTSRVIYKNSDEDGNVIEVETENSIFEFERVRNKEDETSENN